MNDDVIYSVLALQSARRAATPRTNVLQLQSRGGRQDSNQAQ